MSTTAEQRRHIPAELVEKILLNLPVKSLLRYSMVSETWNRMIMGGEFARKYRGREMLMLRLYSEEEEAEKKASALICPNLNLNLNLNLSFPNFVFPFSSELSLCSQVSCDQLLCFELQSARTLCLYNPSTRLYRKLPRPSCPPQIGTCILRSCVSVFVYGLGYDSVSDDYKLLKIHRDFLGETELYSLKTDSWREIADSRRMIADQLPNHLGDWADFHFLSPIGRFAGGAIHWLLHYFWTDFEQNRIRSNVAIISFLVSTEEFRLLPLPPQLPQSLCTSRWLNNKKLDLSVLRGSLCLFMNCGCRLVVWMYVGSCGVWKKDLKIDYADVYPLRYSYLKPLYFNDGDGNLIKAVTSSTDIRKYYIYDKKQDTCLVERSFGDHGVVGAFSFVESLVSPFSGKPSDDDDDDDLIFS